ncbi:MAG TPA: SDR family NAD(P)-dependent oxidoreductase [Myxococcales bacterium]|nr:SDR family NAD(P)-dependent oxidoreductase [Myxococcales bacterium]
MRKALAIACAAAGAVLVLRRFLPRGNLRGRVVLITGGSRVLGLVLARQLVRKGARLVICARDDAELQRAQDDLSRLGGEVLAVPCDVRIASAAERVVEMAVARYGRLDVVINNAGIIEVGPERTMTLADYQTVMGVNFWGAVHVTLAALPHLRRSSSPRVVNITSIGGIVPVPHLLPYTCAKFAMVGFSEGLATEVARDGVQVTTVVPGMMRTGSYVNALFKGKRAAEVSWFSLGGALPVVSLSAERAARRIVLACELGERFVTLGLPAKVLRVAHAVAPGLFVRALSLIDRLLPSAGGANPGEAPEPGWLHRRGVARSALVALADRAARRNLEVPPLPSTTR